MRERWLSQTALAELAEIDAVSRWVRSGSARIHALDYGGDLPPAFFVPGITSPAITLHFVARAVGDLVRPIVVDVRGRGLSDDGDAHTLQSYVNDLAAVVDALGSHDPILVGHSMGARIIGALATLRTVSGAVLVDPPLSGPHSGRYPTPLSAFEMQLEEAYLGTTTERVAEHWPRWPVAEQRIRALWLSSCGHDAVAATHESFESVDFLPIWERLDDRAVLIYGAESAVVTSAGLATLRARNARPIVVRIDRAGHMVFWDRPEVSVTALRDQLVRLLAPRCASASVEISLPRS